MQWEVDQPGQPESSPPLPLPPGLLLLHRHLQLHRPEERDLRWQGERGEGLPVWRLPQVGSGWVGFGLIFITSAPLSSLSALLSPPADWTVKDKGDKKEIIFLGSHPKIHSLSLRDCPSITFPGLPVVSALAGRASATPTRTPPSLPSLRTLPPTRNSWHLLGVSWAIYCYHSGSLDCMKTTCIKYILIHVYYTYIASP